GAPHGLLCGLLLPPVIRFNREAAAAKYARLAVELKLMGPDPHPEAAVEELLHFVETLLRRVEIPLRLSEIGFNPADLDWVARETMPSGSTKANPRSVSEADARRVAEKCL